MKSHSFLKIFLFLTLSSLFICVISFLFGCFRTTQNSIPTVSENISMKYSTVIIDAGHGGEDGGASSAAGLIEKDVNLDIANMLCDMLRANGVDVIMTRTDDRLLYDRNVNYQGRKKKLDLAARLAIAEKTDNAIFVSIHMNSYTDPKYSGLQVWYSRNHPDSFTLAELIQNSNRENLQPENTRKIKSATSSIFLLDNIKSPAVLVECGFLSNADESAKFETKEYRQKLAFILYCSIMDFLNTTTKK